MVISNSRIHLHFPSELKSRFSRSEKLERCGVGAAKHTGDLPEGRMLCLQFSLILFFKITKAKKKNLSK